MRWGRLFRPGAGHRAGRRERDANVDPGPGRGPGVDGDCAADRAYPLPHADQPEPPVPLPRDAIEPGPVIGDPQRNLALIAIQVDPGMACAAVLDGVAQG